MASRSGASRREGSRTVGSHLITADVGEIIRAFFDCGLEPGRRIAFWVRFVESGIGPGNARFRDEKKGQKDGPSGMRGQQLAMARGK